jgi:hypothetical protein
MNVQTTDRLDVEAFHIDSEQIQFTDAFGIMAFAGNISMIVIKKIVEMIITSFIWISLVFVPSRLLTQLRKTPIELHPTLIVQ